MRLPLLVISLLPFVTLAQNEEVPAIPGIVPPPVVAPPGAPVAAPAPPNAALGETQITEAIDQPKLSGNDLAALYRKYTGRRVIVSSSAATAEFAFIQPASFQDPLTYAEAAELLRKAATIENFVFVPDATDPNLDILTLATAGIKPTGRGVSVYTENDALPEGDAVVSYVMNLSYIKPDEAVRTFTQIIGQFGAFGSIAAVPNAASVVITENTSLIRKLIDLKAEIDKPSSQVATRFITVKYADVTELATTLNELLGKQADSNLTAGVQRAQGQPAIQPVIQGELGLPGATSSGEEAPVQIIPDARTNRIFAMGRPVDLLFVEGLVREFDTQSDQRNFLRRKLKYLAVADFLPIAGDALTRAFTGTGSADSGQGQGGGGANRPQNQAQNRAQNNQGGGLFAGGGGNQSGGGGGNSSGGGGGSSGSRGSALSDPQVNSAPESLLVGRTLLVADNITNSIVVQGPPSGVEIIERLLDQVDVKADQVMISTVFGQLSLGKNLSTGVDWIKAFRGNNKGGLGGSSIGGGVTNNRDPLDLFTPVTGTALGTFPSQTGLSLYGKIGNSLAAYVNLLSDSNDFTILSRPSIFTANNQKGTISSGRRIAIPTNSNSFSGGGVSTNIEYRDVVLKLEVVPLVNSDKEITLTIALLSDEVIGQSAPIGDIGSVPIIATRELLTTVTVPNNQTIVLGGLITSNDTETVTGIPLLSDIPGLGRLFSTKTTGVDRSELMIFIQPSIVNNDTSLDHVQTDMDSRYDIAQSSRTFSDGAVLPPLELIEEKGSSPAPRRSPPTAIIVEEETRQNFNRATLRPFHRR
ncbi:MAG: hypothetical protein H7Y36_07100 [Armatimonadetes bacterium]|nr:hypothetical protein [Akkermansiaceae bacterium]